VEDPVDPHSIVDRLPKFRPKSSKGVVGKNFAGRICGRILAEFYQKWQKRGQKKIIEKS
jgi:hypothetical protein